uniref:Uncharacterized protein n=1 Tax=Virgibacillus oceani TaxID=1479511 RepID=A0A917GYG1_9BACI|nr:hypothetical protein GCM10011398_00940 [Virgibacillus oceani]
MQNDFYTLKSELVSKHHLDIRYIRKDDRVNYRIRGNGINKVLSHSPDDLRKMTSTLMSDYLSDIRQLNLNLNIIDIATCTKRGHLHEFKLAH